MTASPSAKRRPVYRNRTACCRWARAGARPAGETPELGADAEPYGGGCGTAWEAGQPLSGHSAKRKAVCAVWAQRAAIVCRKEKASCLYLEVIFTPTYPWRQLRGRGG